MRQHTAFPARKIAMGYTQLTQDERYHIQYLSRHCTIAEIAKQLNRHKSTISREIKRYCAQGRQYGAEKAQRQSRLAKRRKRKPYKLQRQHTDRRQGVRPRRYKNRPPSPAKIRKAHYRPWSNALPAIPSSAN